MPDAAGGANVPPEDKQTEQKTEPKAGKTPAQIERERMRRRRRRQRKRIMKSLPTVPEEVAPGKPLAEPRRPEETHPRPSRPHPERPSRGERPEKEKVTPPPKEEEIAPSEEISLVEETPPAELAPTGETPPVEEKPAEEEETGLTYLAHPFETEEEKPEEAAPAESEKLEETVLPEGEELMLGGEEEEPEVIPVGKLREAAPVGQKKEVTEEETEAEPAKAQEAMKGKEEKEEEVHKVEGKAEKEELPEKKPVYLVIGAALLAALKKAPESLSKFFGALSRILRKIFTILKPQVLAPFLVLVLIAGVGYFGYSQRWHERATSFVTGFIIPKPQEKVAVVIDQNELRRWGVLTADIFANNGGSVLDRVPVQIRIADFFGRLKEPRVKGETGISAATFYGELKDGARVVNEFVQYMSNLEELQSLYKTDVYGMLDRTTDRAGALNDYLEQLKKSQEESIAMLAGIRLNIDDFTTSFESLNPDKSRYETDFFAAMESLQPEKSDLLMKGFIDISQKQTALKARISALTKLAGYYETALKRLEKRIQAVEQNRAALIEGIRVVDIPGADLDIIIRPGS